MGIPLTFITMCFFKGCCRSQGTTSKYPISQFYLPDPFPLACTDLSTESFLKITFLL